MLRGNVENKGIGIRSTQFSKWNTSSSLMSQPTDFYVHVFQIKIRRVIFIVQTPIPNFTKSRPPVLGMKCVHISGTVRKS